MIIIFHFFDLNALFGQLESILNVTVKIKLIQYKIRRDSNLGKLFLLFDCQQQQE